jgi:hypothetical protein
VVAAAFVRVGGPAEHAGLSDEYTDVAERGAARPMLGEARISGTLPITLPDLLPAGLGLTRPGPAPDKSAPAGP